MGFVKRYWQEAEEKKLPHWHKCAIVELVTGEARVQVRGFENIPLGFLPECPKTFATYEEAFAWLERKLTKLAPDRLESAPLQAVFQPALFATSQALSTPTNGR